ncbi:unannotated protein [freshwater metagenome]|uniref:Unannotated protein n=1 Tax=freshwater metagenome TaxID=449393 RepID=A0A6J7DC99_9ZZZZ
MPYEWLIEGLETTWSSTDLLLSSVDESDLDRPTPCPGWTVRDVVSHLIGFELLLAGTAAPEFLGAMPEHVRNDIGKINEAFVFERRHRSKTEIMEEFRQVTRAALARLRGLDQAAWEVVGWSPEGQAPYHRFVETRILDSWIHLQDLRDALALPEDDHGIGEEIVVNRFEAALPYVIGKRAQAPEGSRIRLNLEGRVGRSVEIEVLEGRAQGAKGPGEPTLEISTPVALFWRRAAGRISSEALLQAAETNIRGDRVLAQRIAEALAIMI